MRRSGAGGEQVIAMGARPLSISRGKRQPDSEHAWPPQEPGQHDIFRSLRSAYLMVQPISIRWRQPLPIGDNTGLPTWASADLTSSG
jgi:hypothetical protein